MASEPPITAIAFAPGGEEVVAVSQSGLHVFEWPQLEPVRTIDLAIPNLHAVAFSPDGAYLAVGGGFPSEQGIVTVVSWPDREVVATFRGHHDSVRSLAWLKQAKLVSASMDRGLLLWDLESDQAISKFEGHSRSVDAVCLLPDGKTLVSAGADQSLRVWDLETGELVQSRNQHTGAVHALAIRPSEDALPMVASCAADRTIRFWQPTIGRMVRYIRLDAEPLNMAWLEDSRRLAASCADGHVRIIDAENLAILQDLPAIDGWAYTIKAHPSDGSLAVGGSNGQIRRLAREAIRNVADDDQR